MLVVVIQIFPIAGGDHIDTRAVRSYLSNLEISLKMGKYEFGPAKPTDTRTMDRPYSKLSWRDKDLANMDRRAKSKLSREDSKAGSIIRSRPSSYRSDLIGPSMSRHSSISHLSASEKLMLESDRPRLLHRENFNERKLKPSPPESEVSSPKKQVTVEIKINGDETDRKEDVQTRVASQQIDSFGEEIRETEHLQQSNEMKRTQFAEAEKVPVRLFHRYSSAGSTRSSVSKQYIDKSVARVNSARSYGSSHITGVSYYSKSSLRSNQSRRSVHSRHGINSANTRSVTVGPSCDLTSLVEKSSPRDISKNIHHRSAWYHVPGRYATSDKPFPPKRSQKTKEVQELDSRFSYRPPLYHVTYKARHLKQRSSPTSTSNQGQQNVHPFGMTVKSLGPVMSSGYYGNEPEDYMVNGDLDMGHHGTTVKFKEAVIVE